MDDKRAITNINTNLLSTNNNNSNNKRPSLQELNWWQQKEWETNSKISPRKSIKCELY